MKLNKNLIALTLSSLVLPTISHADTANSCAALLKIGIYNLAQSDNVVDSDLLKKSSFCAYDYNKIQTSPSQMALIEDAYKLFGNVGGATSLAQITDAQTRVCAAGFGSDIYRVQAAPSSQNVYQNALDAWNNCQSLAQQGVNFNLQPDSTMQSVIVTFSTTSTGIPATLNNLGQTGIGRSICEATLSPRNGSFSGKTIAVDKTTSLKFDANNKLMITCQRQMANNGKGDLSADEQSLIFNTSVGSYQVPIAAIGSLSRMSVDKATSQIQNTMGATLVPAGTVVPFAGDKVPDGFLLCDGRSLSRTDYPKLFAAIGTAHGSVDANSFNLPDYSGRFLRGVDGSAGNDPDKDARTPMKTGGNAGNLVGSVQGDMFASHTHSYRAGDSDAWNGSVGNMYGLNHYMNTYENGFIGAKGGNETRPKNAYVNYLIKF